jgi:hypothetical protein
LIADAFHLPQFGIEEASEDSALALLLQDECIKHVVKVFDLRAKVFVLERLLQSVDHFLIQTGFVGFRRDIEAAAKGLSDSQIDLNERCRLARHAALL